MTKQELAQQVAAFTQSGGKIKQCADGDQAIRQIPRNLIRCECGCNGDYTDHSMRAGESGRCASIIIH